VRLAMQKNCKSWLGAPQQARLVADEHMRAVFASLRA
jgi:hypothetical protein